MHIYRNAKMYSTLKHCSASLLSASLLSTIDPIYQISLAVMKISPWDYSELINCSKCAESLSKNWSGAML